MTERRVVGSAQKGFAAERWPLRAFAHQHSLLRLACQGPSRRPMRCR
jgi:hypothetical protein